MTNPRDLIQAVVEDLRSVPDFNEFAASIQPFDDQSPTYRTVDEAVGAMIGTGILVIWQGTSIGRRGTSPRWRHQFRLVLKGAGLYDAAPEDPGFYNLVSTLIDQAPEGQPRWIERAVHPSCDPPEVTDIRPLRGDGVNVVEVSFNLVEIFG